jgi:hypothetical protein
MRVGRVTSLTLLTLNSGHFKILMIPLMMFAHRLLKLHLRLLTGLFCLGLYLNSDLAVGLRRLDRAFSVDDLYLFKVRILCSHLKVSRFILVLRIVIYTRFVKVLIKILDGLVSIRTKI